MSWVTFSGHAFLALLLALSPSLASQEKPAAEFDRWVKELQSSSGRQRTRAVYALGNLGDRRAVEHLIGALLDRDDRVRRAAVRWLEKSRDPRAVPALIAALEDDEHRIREDAVSALGNLGDRRAVDPLRAAWSRASLRLAVVQALGELGDKAAVPSLLAALDATDGSVRMCAAEALDKLGWRPADDVEKARYLAARKRWDELRRLGVPAVGPLVTALQQMDQNACRSAALALDALGWKARDEREQAYYLAALGKWKEVATLGPDVVECLVRTLAMRQTARQKKVVEVVETIGVPARTRLVALLRHEDEDVAGRAAEVLGRLRDVGSLAAALDDRRTRLRLWIVDTLSELRDPRALEPLLARLGDEDAWVRFAAAEALGKLGDARAVKPLDALLEDPDRRVRYWAAWALSRLGDHPIAPLVGILQKEDDPFLRREAVSELAKISGARVVEPLVAALEDEHESVKMRVADALDKLGFKPKTDQQRALLLVARGRHESFLAAAELGRPALKPILASLEHAEDDDVRAFAIEALLLLMPVAKPTIEEALEKASRDPSPKVRDIAALALQVTRQPGRAVTPDRSEPSKLDRLLADLSGEDAPKRLLAARGLGRLGDPRAVEPLLAALQDEALGVRQAAAEALGKLKDPRAFEPLVARLQDRSEHVRWEAAEALGKLGDPRALQPLCDALKDRDSTVRRSAATALGELKDPRALAPLVAALKDWRIQAPVIAALGKLGDERAIEPILDAAQLRNFDDRGEFPRAMARIGRPSLKPLLGALTDEVPRVRVLASMALGELGDNDAAEPLSGALKDLDSGVRYDAARALRRLAWQPRSELERAYFLVAEQSWAEVVKLGRVGLEPLLLASKNGQPHVRRGATEALAQIRR